MAIDIHDYSRTAAQRGWGEGWPRCSGARDDLATVVTKRSGTKIVTRRRLARLQQILLDWTEDPTGGNYLLKPNQCGGYNCRAISGTKVASNHSWAVANDLNWNDNPYTTTGRFNIPVRVARTWNGYGFAWGGDYRGARKDYMHFEFMGTPTDADDMTEKAVRELLDTHPEDDMTPEQSRMLQVVYRELTQLLPSRSDYNPDPPRVDTLFGVTLNAEKSSHEALVELRDLVTKLSGLVWEHLVVNMNGEQVPVKHIVSATEGQVADLKTEVAELKTAVADLAKRRTN